MARENKGKGLKSFPWEYMCIDVETTGVNPKFDRIIEVCAIHVKNRRIKEKFSSLVQLSGKRVVSEKVQKLTGITNEMLKEAPSADEVIPQFHQFVGEYIWVGHNVNFDINFLYDACERRGLLLQNDYIDTLPLARDNYPELKHYSLADIVKYLKIEQSGAHRAESDAIATAKCFERMRSKNFHIENIDEYAREQMLLAIKRAKKYEKHIWELTSEDTL